MTLPSRSEVEQTLASFEGCTPGPWELVRVGDGLVRKLCPISPDRVSILTLTEEDGNTFATVLKDADANLIERAPQLVEWVRELMDEVERLRERIGEMDIDLKDYFAEAVNIRAERDRLSAQLSAQRDYSRDATIAAQSERIEALEKDAARYQYLRNVGPHTSFGYYVTHCEIGVLHSKKLDVAIDAARLDATNPAVSDEQGEVE